jgi:hypothetical protein
MYGIQIDQRHWLGGIWRGWLVRSAVPNRALVYRSLQTASNAVQFYGQVAPEGSYTVHRLSQEADLFFGPE